MTITQTMFDVAADRDCRCLTSLRIRNVASLTLHIEVSLAQAFRIWEWYSSTKCAGWLDTSDYSDAELVDVVEEWVGAHLSLPPRHETI